MKTEKVMLASFELRPVSSCQRAIRQTLGGNNPSDSFIDSWVTKADEKLYLYDQQGVVTAETVLEVVYYAAEKLKCTNIILDSLMKCGVAEDNYQQQKEFIDKLCIAARDLKCHIHMIAHARKRSDDIVKPPSKHDVSGSANITNLVDNCFIIYRTDKDQKLEAGKITEEEYDAMPTTMVYCVKQRHFEWEGHWAFWFDTESLRFSPINRVDRNVNKY
jgi:twinkle protein